MLRRIFLGIILNGIALYAVTQLLDGITYTGDLKFFLLGGLVIGTLNAFVKPLLKLFSLPFIVLTAGLFSFVINVLIFWLTVKLVNGIHIADVTVAVDGIVTYILAALVFGIVNWVLHLVINNK